MYKKSSEVKGYQDLPPATMTINNSLAVKTGPWRNFRPVIDPGKCNVCFLCWRCCPEPCIDITDKESPPKVNYDYCKGCGICANECPKNAIEMIFEETD